MQSAGESLHAECSFLEKTLAGQHYLCGDRPSAAEAVAFPDVRLIQRALDRRPDVMKTLGFDDAAGRYPYLFDWMRRLESMDGMANTLPYHW